MSFEEAIETVARRSLAYITGLLMAVTTFQTVFGPTLPVTSFLLGTAQVATIPLVAAMAIWTFGIVALALMISIFLSSATRVIYISLRPSRQES